VVSSDNLGGIQHESRFPKEGHISISDQPGMNLERIDWTIFEGTVRDHLVVELYGEELDTLSANDHLDSYRREFRGPVSTWLGTYGPGDDFSGDVSPDDPEMMSNWRLAIYIDPV
jgi:hypothetical protein